MDLLSDFLEQDFIIPGDRIRTVELLKFFRGSYLWILIREYLQNSVGKRQGITNRDDPTHFVVLHRLPNPWQVGCHTGNPIHHRFNLNQPESLGGVQAGKH